MRILVTGLVLVIASAALAQDRYSPTLSSDNPQLFVQPEEPPLPQQKQAEPPQAARQPALERVNVPTDENVPERQNVNGRDDERQSVGGRDTDDQTQRLFDQWNAPGQSKGGTATVRVVE